MGNTKSDGSGESNANPASQRLQWAGKQMAHLRKRLLDLTNRNPLLNFRHRERSRSQLRVVGEPPDGLYARLMEGESLPFTALPEPENKPRDEETSDFAVALETARYTDEAYLQDIERIENEEPGAKSFERAERELRDRVRDQLGLPQRASPDAMSMADYAQSHGIDPSYELPASKGASAGDEPAQPRGIQVLLLPNALERKLSGLYDLYWTNLDETGVNTLYMAIGFLEWYDPRRSEKPMHAPLLLHPVELTRELKGHHYRFTISDTGEETATNLTLAARLKQDAGLRLPELAEEERPEDYLERVGEMIESKRGWRVRRWITLGHFAFARLVMYRDLAPEEWPIKKSFQHHPTLVDLFGGREREEPLFAEEYDPDKPEVAEKVPALITEADASQFSAVVDVMEGRNLAIKGPPGTGKSQTITNIIAAAMAAGKRVLFVAEKMAALEVVKSRLDAAGVGAFCVELHSTKARKRELLQELEERLELQKRARRPGYYQNALEELQETREALRNYAERINREVGSLGKSLYEVMWDFQCLREREDIPEGTAEVRIPDAESLTAYDAERRKLNLRALGAHMQEMRRVYGAFERHPWYGVGKQGFGDREQSGFVDAMATWRDAVAHLIGLLAEAPESLGQACVMPNRLAEVRSFIGEIKGVVQGLELPDSAESEPTLMRAVLDPQARDALRSYIDHYEAYRELDAYVGGFTSAPQETAAHAQALQGAIEVLQELGMAERTVEELAEELEGMRQQVDWWEQAYAYAVRVAKAFGLPARADPYSLYKPLRALQLLESTERKALTLREPAFLDEGNGERLEEARERAYSLKLELKRWQKQFVLPSRDTVSSERLREHARTLRAGGLLSRLKRRFREAEQFYQDLRREKAEVGPPQRATEMEALAELLDAIRDFEEDTDLRELCGKRFQGLETDFDRLLAVNQFGISVRTQFGSDATGRPIRALLLNADQSTLDELLALAQEPMRPALEEALQSLIEEKSDFRGRIQSLKNRAERLRAAYKAFTDAALGGRVKISEVSELVSSLSRLEALREAAQPSHPALEGVDLERFTREELENWIATGERWVGRLGDGASESKVAQFLVGDRIGERLKAVSDWVERLEADLQRVDEAAAEASAKGEINASTYFQGEVDMLPLEQVRDRLERSLQAKEALRDWVSALQLKATIRDDGLGELLGLFDRAGCPYDALEDGFDLALYATLIAGAMDASPELQRFSGIGHEQLRKRFQELDEEILELQRRNLRAQLSQQKIDPGEATGARSTWTGLKLIQNEMGKRRRHIPIRELFSRAGRAIQQMKPCFMMSPLSVAQFLKPGQMEFDLVVIDEASQMRPEDALGSIARGNQLVVVGDPMQLPPTSFFERQESTAYDTSETEVDEVADNESILDLMLAVYRPSRQLRWHYRSRHGSLIAFSNHHFYQDSLVVFPAPLERHPDVGVQKVFVGGHYKGRVNPEEAKQVARSAIDFMKRHPDRSLGIVALNQPQRELLVEETNRLIAEEDTAQAYLERWAQKDGGLQKFFVKNLENVQGDERDVIFISTVFGPEADSGRVMQRFGPINSQVGHRRLNVLFTRARWQVVVFTSMNPTDIKLDGSPRLGVRALRDYLEFAESGSLGGEAIVDADAGISDGSAFQAYCVDVLRRHGYEVVTEVGVKGYTLDLAVRDPSHPDRFMLAIESDGPNYYSSLATRDRDRLREKVLKSLGWDLYRVWSPDWYYAPGRELENLVARLEREGKAKKKGDV